MADPFSSATFTNRQSDYGTCVFRTTAIYTPQLVVDGAAEAVGSDRPSVHAAVAAAAGRPAADLHLRAALIDGRMHVDVDHSVPETVQPAWLG